MAGPRCVSQGPQLALCLALLLCHEHILRPKSARLKQMSRAERRIYTCQSFGPKIAIGIRRDSPAPEDKKHLDASRDVNLRQEALAFASG